MIDEGLYSERDYIAPTVFKKAGVSLGTSSWNYYNTLNEAIVKYKYLNKLPGGANITPAGGVTFNGTAAETFGINCDFYIRKSDGRWYATTYKFLRSNVAAYPVIFRFYTRDGNGAFYAILDWKNFALSATPVDDVSSEKLAALDTFYRNVQLLKYSYNSLAAFANSLAQRQLTAAEQQIFNEAVLKIQNMQAEMLSIKGIEINFSKSGVVAGSVGVVPFLIIAIVLIIAAAASWTIVSIMDQAEKTQRINDTYELGKWISQKKLEIAQAVRNGTITEGQAGEINKTLDNAQATATQVANNASKPGTSLIGDITKLVQWGVIGFVAFEGIKLFKSRKTATA